MSDGWGNEAGTPADAGGWGDNTTTNTNSGADAWGTGDEPHAGDGDAIDSKPAAPPLPFERREAPIAEWQEKKAYDYEAYATGSTGEWAGNAQVYEWDGEEGDIGPESAELEKILFGTEEERGDNEVIDFKSISEINVLQESIERINPVMSFDAAGLHPAMRRNVELAGFNTPTPIQQYCLPAIHQGRDMIAIAQTGSGKTAAYLIPIINKLMGKAKKLAAPRPHPTEIDAGVAAGVTAEPLVVIVCPARELAVQIFTEARKFCYRTMLRPAVVYGGGPLRDQIQQLQKGCDVLIASPGRLIDLMERPQVLSLRRVRYMVIDEADEMLQQDWEEEFNKILSGGEQEEGNVKYMLFSATFPTQIRKLAKDHLAASHIRIRVGRIGSTHANIEQQVIWVDHFLKKRALLDLLYSLEPGRTIIFVNNKRLADELDDYLFHNEMPCTSMHSDRTQREREDAMRAFRNGSTPILIATGVTARGIDVRNVKYVINYDMPSTEHGGITEYTHRIGRTARAGLKGKAISFYTEKDEPIAEVLTKTLLETNQEIPEFLQQYVPEGEDAKNLKFEPGSDEEDEGVDDAAGAGGWAVDGGSGGGDSAGGWGNSGDSNTATAPTAPTGGDDAGGWGAGVDATSSTAW
ncbi:ATP-dependent RNA helicase DED1-like protein 2 [Seiridium cupressi]